MVGNGVITFKKTTPKKLAAKNEVIFLAIQALIELKLVKKVPLPA